ncbi:MAG: hypothetical protein ABIO81_09885 [Ginsengibacter sp.]
MKTKHLLLLGIIVFFSSCTTAYRTGQTPDDVYYSPAPSQDAYVKTDNQNDRETYASNNDFNRENVEIRRGIRDSRYRNEVIVDPGYGYDPYGYSNTYGYYNPYLYNTVYVNPYYNYYNSPYHNYYYSPQIYIYPKTKGTVTSATGPRKYNLGAYNNVNGSKITISNHGYRPANSTSAPVRTIKTTSSNTNRGIGNFIRRVITPDNNNRVYSNDNNYNNSNSSPARTTQSSSSGSSNSSSGSSSAPVRTFRK